MEQKNGWDFLIEILGIFPILLQKQVLLSLQEEFPFRVAPYSAQGRFTWQPCGR